MLGLKLKSNITEKTYYIGKFCVLDIKDELTITYESRAFDDYIDELIKDKNYNIAVKFLHNSSICSGGISLLIHNNKRIKEYGGEICILEPGPKIKEILDATNLNFFFRSFADEKELLEYQE